MIAADFADRRLRRNLDYEVVDARHLSAPERERFGDMADDPGFAALLRPRKGTLLNYRAVGPELLALLEGLGDEGGLPEGLLSTDDRDETVRQLALLVLDGVLEIELDAGFASGRAALPAVRRIDDEVEPGTALARLSLAALRYGEALRLTSPRLLANRLYSYNGEPITELMEARWRDEEAVLRGLGLRPGDERARRLADRWRGPKLHNGWLSYSRREGRIRTKPTEPMYKVYVSPKLEALSDAFGAVLETIDATAANVFKVGANLQGLARPDKLVLYFADRQSVDDAAALLMPRLAGTLAQGVPFSAPLDQAGVVSWGMDPPREDRTPGRSPSSWRLWVVERLATALVQATAEPSSGVPAWRFAIERLAIEGVDVNGWSPKASAWPFGDAG